MRAYFERINKVIDRDREVGANSSFPRNVFIVLQRIDFDARKCALNGSD